MGTKPMHVSLLQMTTAMVTEQSCAGAAWQRSAAAAAVGTHCL